MNCIESRSRGRPRTRYVNQIMQDAGVTTSYGELENIERTIEKNGEGIYYEKFDKKQSSGGQKKKVYPPFLARLDQSSRP